jgi:hypothetical protein
MVGWKITGAITALVIATSSVLACDGNEIFSDDFSDPILSADLWGVSDSNAAISLGAGYLEIKSAPGYKNRVAVPSGTRDFDVCVDITFPAAKNPDGGTEGGLIFGLSDWDNLYEAAVTPVGGFGVFRRTKGKAIAVSAPFKVYPQINKGAGAKNTLRISLKGNTGTVYANGQRLTAFRAVASDLDAAASNLSLYATSEADQVNPWRFGNLKLAEPK